MVAVEFCLGDPRWGPLAATGDLLFVGRTDAARTCSGVTRDVRGKVPSNPLIRRVLLCRGYSSARNRDRGHQVRIVHSGRHYNRSRALVEGRLLEMDLRMVRP